MAYVWSVECPHDDQGMVAPLVTESGRIVLMCDRGGEVWLKRADIGSIQPATPKAPDWQASADVHVTPGTTRWAQEADLDQLSTD